LHSYQLRDEFVRRGEVDSMNNTTGGHGRPGLVIVDHQVHWYPRSCVQALEDRATYPKTERTEDGGHILLLDDGLAQPAMDKLTADVDQHLAAADAAGIDALVIGPATLAEVSHLPAAEAVDLLDGIHQEYAAAQRAHPDRVACLAALPMQAPSAALAMLDRAVGELGLRGVSLLTSNDGRPLVGEGTVEVFARIAELGVPLFLHPGLRSATRAHTRTAREEVGLSWMYQTARAALELVDSGVLDAVPDLVVVHPHLGGALPYVAGRVSQVGGSKAKHPLEHYLATRFYVDTAASTPAALQLAIQTYGIDRVVFATDHPFGPMAGLRHYVEGNLPADTATRIYANRVPGLSFPASTASV
jgi:aminocarboxymuconate-semialdehyde decarboxylase